MYPASDYPAMFSLRRPFAGVLQRSLSAQSLPARWSSTAAVASEEYEALTIPPIFDIFDAPVRLGESSALIGRTSTTARITTLERNGEKSPNFVRDLSRDQYSSLPPPIVFDGPARPAHLLPRAIEHRHKMRQHLRSSPNKQTYRPASSFASPSEIVCEVFDGPARITRYKYPTSSSESSSLPYICLALAAVFGMLMLEDELQNQRRPANMNSHKTPSSRTHICRWAKLEKASLRPEICLPV